MQRALQAVLALAAWFTVILQYVNHPQNIIRFFSYFTILTNTLVALAMTAVLLRLQWRLARALTGHSGQTALALYIIVVGLVYNLLLRGHWRMSFWPWLADNLAHLFIPLLYLLYWLLCLPAGILAWRDVRHWLWFPSLYFVWSLLHGALANWYPYFFFDVGHSGLGMVLVNGLLLALVMLLLGLALIAINRRSWRSSVPIPASRELE